MSDEATSAARCPHCGTIADVEPSRRLRYRCLVCGGPRVPVDVPGVGLEPQAKQALERAQRLRFERASWTIGAGVVGAFGVLSAAVVLLALALISPGWFATVLALAMASAPLAVAAYGWRRSRQVGRDLDARLDEAWKLTLAELLRALATRGQARVDAAFVARALRLDPPRADQLLAELEVNDLATSELESDGTLTYSGRPVVRPRVAAELVEQEIEREGVHGDEHAPDESTRSTGRDQRA